MHHVSKRENREKFSINAKEILSYNFTRGRKLKVLKVVKKIKDPNKNWFQNLFADKVETTYFKMAGKKFKTEGEVLEYAGKLLKEGQLDEGLYNPEKAEFYYTSNIKFVFINNPNGQTVEGSYKDLQQFVKAINGIRELMELKPLAEL